MTMTIRKAVRTELDDIATQLIGVHKQQETLKIERTELSKRFLELLERHVEQDGRSRTWPVPQLAQRVRATWAEPTIPVNYDQFMRSVGPELFAELCTVKTATLDVEKWNQAVSEERAMDSQLQKCVGKSKPRAPGIYIEPILTNGEAL